MDLEFKEIGSIQSEDTFNSMYAECSPMYRMARWSFDYAQTCLSHIPQACKEASAWCEVLDLQAGIIQY